MTEIEKKFKVNLYNLRTKQGLTKKQLALQISLDQAYYSRLENMNHHVEPTFITIEKISLFYKIKPYELFI